jgi:hypothetical protein
MSENTNFGNVFEQFCEKVSFPAYVDKQTKENFFFLCTLGSKTNFMKIYENYGGKVSLKFQERLLNFANYVNSLDPKKEKTRLNNIIKFNLNLFNERLSKEKLPKEMLSHDFEGLIGNKELEKAMFLSTEISKNEPLMDTIKIVSICSHLSDLDTFISSGINVGRKNKKIIGLVLKDNTRFLNERQIDHLFNLLYSN